MSEQKVMQNPEELTLWEEFLVLIGIRKRKLLYNNGSGLVPLGHAVLVRPYEPEIQVGKIHIPDNVRLTMQSLDQRAEVIAVGPKAWEGEGEARAKPGDRVLVTKFAGFVAGGTLTKDGQTYRIVNDRDLFCRIDWRE